MKTRYYSEEEIDVIREFAGKKIAEEIGIMLGRTRDSVLNRASRSKICLRLEGENHRGAKLSNLQAQMVKVREIFCLFCTGRGHSKFKRMLKWHYLFKSYGSLLDQ